MRQATYAPDSLVQVQVEVRNTSSHAIGLAKNCLNAKRLWVEVLQGQEVVYPPVLHVPGRLCRPIPSGVDIPYTCLYDGGVVNSALWFLCFVEREPQRHSVLLPTPQPCDYPA